MPIPRTDVFFLERPILLAPPLYKSARKPPCNCRRVVTLLFYTEGIGRLNAAGSFSWIENEFTEGM